MRLLRRESMIPGHNSGAFGTVRCFFHQCGQLRLDTGPGTCVWFRARMAKLADAADLKSAGRKAVGVQVPLRAPLNQQFIGKYLDQ